MPLIQGTGNQYVPGKVTMAGIPDRLHSPDVIEGWTDEAIHDVQLRIAGWLVEFGYESGRLTKDEFDEIRVVFEACGLPNHVLPRVIPGTTPREAEYATLERKPANRVSIKSEQSPSAKQRSRHRAHGKCDKCGKCACSSEVARVQKGLCENCWG